MTRSFFSSSAVALLSCLATTPATAQQRGDPVQQSRPNVSPQAAAIGYDGAYAGSMSQSVGHLGAHSNPNCVFSRPVSMRIERGDVTISYTDWGGHKIDYRGKVDPAGKINAWHTNGDGSSSSLRVDDADPGSRECPRDALVLRGWATTRKATQA